MHYPYKLDKCRLGGSTIAGMVHRRVEPAQRRVLDTFAVKSVDLSRSKRQKKFD